MWASCKGANAMLVSSRGEHIAKATSLQSRILKCGSLQQLGKNVHDHMYRVTWSGASIESKSETDTPLTLAMLAMQRSYTRSESQMIYR